MEHIQKLAKTSQVLVSSKRFGLVGEVGSGQLSAGYILDSRKATCTDMAHELPGRETVGLIYLYIYIIYIVAVIQKFLCEIPMISNKHGMVSLLYLKPQSAIHFYLMSAYFCMGACNDVVIITKIIHGCLFVWVCGCLLS